MHESGTEYEVRPCRVWTLALPDGGIGALAAWERPGGAAFAAVTVDAAGRPRGATGRSPMPPAEHALNPAALGCLVARDGALSDALRRLGLAPGNPRPSDPDAGLRLAPGHAALAPVASRLSGDAVSALGRTAVYGSDLYAHFAAAGARGEDRRRLARGFPGHADVIRSAPVSAALERGATLREGLSAFCEGRPGARLGAGHVRAFRRSDWGDMGLESKRRLMGMLARMPSNWMPPDPDAAAAARLLQPLHAALVGLTGDGTAMRGCSGRWRDFLARAVAATGRPEGRLAEAPEGWASTARDLAVRVVVPALARDEGLAEVDLGTSLPAAGAATARLLFGGLSLRAAADLHARWLVHAGPPVATVRSGLDRWPALGDPWRAPCGAWLVPLTDAASLAAEGEALDHCVGGFREACASGAVHVASVRADGRPLSTVEFEIGQAGGLRVRQHRGLGNARPPSRAAVAVDAYAASVATGLVPLAPDAVESSARHRAAAAASLDAACGYDWRDPDAAAVALASLQPALPDRLRGFPAATIAAMAARAFHKAPCDLVAGLAEEPSVQAG